MKSIQADPMLRLQVIASGMHLSREFGSTWKEITSEGICIDRKIGMRMQGRSSLDNLDSIALGVKGFGTALSELQPEIIVLLGDRFELLAPAISALMLGIPIAHIHGGELSEGAIDDSVRHAITKFASLHFPATDIYRRRILQMGELPQRVFNFGAPGLDQIHATQLMSRSQLEQNLEISFQRPVAIVTFHPSTRGRESPIHQATTVLRAIESCRLTAVFTMANADAQGAIINQVFSAACEADPEHFKWVPHLGRTRYLSCLKYAAVMVGNSSSGITEASSFRLPVVNIGDRQRGRVRAANIIDVTCTESEIRKAIRRAITTEFKSSLKRLRNPYDRFHDGRTSERIKNVLKSVSMSDEFLKKSFYELS